MCQDPDHLFPWFQILTQNKEAISFISVVTYGVFIHLSHPIQFCPLTNQKFEKNAQDPADPAKPWIQDPSGFLPIFMGFKSCHQRNPLSYKTLQHGQSGAILRNTVDHHVLSELPFKHKTPQGMEHVCPGAMQKKTIDWRGMFQSLANVKLISFSDRKCSYAKKKLMNEEVVLQFIVNVKP